MLEIQDLSESEITEILARVGYGHLACSRDDRPYVVPIQYVYEDGEIFIYTTEGKKFDIISRNPRVCLQVEEVIDHKQWQSVIVDGIAEQLASGDAQDRALKLILRDNPTLTPAVSIRWLDSWVRENREVIYRITIKETSGRRAVDRHGKTPSIPIRGSKGTVI